MDLSQRFWAKVNRGDPDDCWEWRAGQNKYGYGKVKVEGRYKAAHRISWAISVGPIPRDMCVCHKCDNKVCVNPNHLFLGTHADNAADMRKKGRFRPRGKVPITLEQRELIKLDKRPQKEIAKEYGVTQQHISALKRGRW